MVTIKQKRPSTKMKSNSWNIHIETKKESQHKNRSRRVTSLVQPNRKVHKNNRNKAQKWKKQLKKIKHRETNNSCVLTMLLFVLFSHSCPKSDENHGIIELFVLLHIFDHRIKFKNVSHFLCVPYLLSFLVRCTCTSC